MSWIGDFRLKKITCRLRSHPSYGKYLRQLKDGTLRIDKQAVREAEKYDGKYLIRTSDDITQGEKGIILKNKKGEHGALPAPKTEVIDVTGAGDAFISGFLYGIHNGKPLVTACQLGICCSIITLQTKETVCSNLNEQLLKQTYAQYFSWEV